MTQFTDEQIQNQDRWVEALLSGEYKQAQDQLRARDCETSEWSYCCLGVLCDVLRPHDGEWDTAEYRFGDAGVWGTSLGVIEWEQLTGMPREAMEYLINMNDDEPASFQEIAGAVREMRRTRVVPEWEDARGVSF